MNRHPESVVADAWYRQPIAWLGMVIFIVSMAGCIWMIDVSLRYDETATHGVSQTLLGVPVPTKESEAPP